MSQNDPSPIRVSLPWGLLGMLALIVAVERFAARHENDLFLKIEHWTWRQIGRLADSPPGAPRIVCLGDSLVQVGIAAPIVEERTGRITYNMAISGGPVVASYLLLRRAVESGGSPEAVVLDCFPRLLEADPLDGSDPWSSIASVAECADLAWSARRPAFLARTVVAKAVPTVRMRYEIRGAVVAALRGEPMGARQFVPPSLVRNLRVNRGGVLCPPHQDRIANLDDWASRNCPPAWTCHPVNRLYLERLLTLTTERRIPVFWLLPPYEPELQARCESSGFDSRHDAFVWRVAADYPNVTVVDGRRSGCGPDDFLDPHHLARSGAAAFSTGVAGVVAAALESPPKAARWVSLPADQARRIDVPLEDLEQSKLAVRSELAVRRR